MKGGQTFTTKTGEKVNLVYLWNVMDRRTRFLLASRLSARRDRNGAIRAFMDANRTRARVNQKESSPIP